MPINKHKARKLAHEIVNNPQLTYDEIGAKVGYKESPHRRIAVYDALQSPTVINEIRKELAKVHSKEELQGGLSKYIDKIDAELEKNGLNEQTLGLLKEYRGFVLDQAKVSGLLVEKSMNININANVSAKESKDLNTDDLINALTRR